MSRIERVLFRAGFRFTHAVGSHRQYANNLYSTTISFHPGDVPRHILKKVLKQAGLTEEQFTSLLRGKRAA